MYTISIDKLIVIFTIPEDHDKYSHYSCVLNYITLMREENHRVWKLKYATKCAIKLGGKNTLLLQAGTSHHKLYVKFEFNPNKLSKEEWTDLYIHMSLLLDYGYHTLYEEGKINYIEIAADVPNVEFDSIFVYDEKMKRSNYNFQEFGSVYLGSKSSSRSFIVYDKAKELKDNFGVSLDHPLTRIEARLANLPLTLGQLNTLSNPFASLHVGWITELRIKKGDQGWNCFKKWCQAMGVQEALTMNGKSRKKFLDIMAEIESPELSPSKCWGQLPEAFDVLKPPAFFY